MLKKTPRRPARTGRRIQPYIAAALYARLRTYCAQTGHTETAVIEAALKAYLDGISDHSLLMQAINRSARQATRTQESLEVLTETIVLFLQRWLAYTPDLPAKAPERQAFDQHAQLQWRRFTKLLGARLSAGRRLLNDLSSKVGNSDELDSLRAETTPKSLESS